MYLAIGLINRGANVGKNLVIFAFSPWFSPKNSLARFSRKVQLRPRLRTTTHQKFTHIHKNSPGAASTMSTLFGGGEYIPAPFACGWPVADRW